MAKARCLGQLGVSTGLQANDLTLGPINSYDADLAILANDCFDHDIQVKVDNQYEEDQLHQSVSQLQADVVSQLRPVLQPFREELPEHHTWHEQVHGCCDDEQFPHLKHFSLLIALDQEQILYAPHKAICKDVQQAVDHHQNDLAQSIQCVEILGSVGVFVPESPVSVQKHEQDAVEDCENDDALQDGLVSLFTFLSGQATLNGEIVNGVYQLVDAEAHEQ